MGLKCALRCTPLERARIRERAAEYGMSVSAFLVACALNVEDAGADEPRLALTDAEERLLFDRVAELDRLRRMLFERLPGSDVSVFGALAFIERALGDRGLDG